MVGSTQRHAPGKLSELIFFSQHAHRSTAHPGSASLSLQAEVIPAIPKQSAARCRRRVSQWSEPFVSAPINAAIIDGLALVLDGRARPLRFDCQKRVAKHVSGGTFELAVEGIGFTLAFLEQRIGTGSGLKQPVGIRRIASFVLVQLTFGKCISALAITMRWCWPPENILEKSLCIRSSDGQYCKWESFSIGLVQYIVWISTFIRSPAFSIDFQLCSGSAR